MQIEVKKVCNICGKEAMKNGQALLVWANLCLSCYMTIGLGMIKKPKDKK